jgi:hypothetical protein
MGQIKWLRQYRKGDVIFIVDEIDGKLGFARCTDAIPVMNKENHEMPIVFYRLMTNQNVSFADKQELKEVVHDLNLSSRYNATTLGTRLVKRSIDYIDKQVTKRKSGTK